MMEQLKQAFGYVCYLPFVFAYSFLMGPILATVLAVGGLAFLLAILGNKQDVVMLIRALQDKELPDAVPVSR